MRVTALTAIRTLDDHTAPFRFSMSSPALRRTNAVDVALTCARPHVLAEELGDDIECTGGLAVLWF